jgi:hypothetical protein
MRIDKPGNFGMPMVSHDAASIAFGLCCKSGENFSHINRRCLSYLSMLQQVVGSFTQTEDADQTFINLVKSELELSGHDDGFSRHHEVWGSA